MACPLQEAHHVRLGGKLTSNKLACKHRETDAVTHQCHLYAMSLARKVTVMYSTPSEQQKQWGIFSRAPNCPLPTPNTMLLLFFMTAPYNAFHARQNAATWFTFCLATKHVLISSTSSQFSISTSPESCSLSSSFSVIFAILAIVSLPCPTSSSFSASAGSPRYVGGSRSGKPFTHSI